MELITFEQLPKAVTQLCEDMAIVKRLLSEKDNVSQPEPDQFLTVDQTAEFLKLAKPTIYGLISKGDLPVMKRSKRCYFSKADLISYLKEGRKLTGSEAAQKANEYVNRKRQ